MNELGIKPEHECFDLGHVGSLAPLVDMGVLKPPLHVVCVMGVIGGIPPTRAQPRGDGRQRARPARTGASSGSRASSGCSSAPR